MSSKAWKAQSEAKALAAQVWLTARACTPAGPTRHNLLSSAHSPSLGSHQPWLEKTAVSPTQVPTSRPMPAATVLQNEKCERA